jgi:uncharacterized protein YndB with AHSA1/START domain
MTLELREVVAIDIPVPIATLWPYLRDPHLVHRWFGWDDVGLEAEILQIFQAEPHESQDVVGGSTVHTLTWPHRDVLTARSAISAPGHTQVSVTRASHDGTSSYDGIRDEVDEGWIAFVHQLAFAVTVHPGQERRTLSILGLDAGAPGDRLLDHAGIGGIGTVPIGGHVQARRPDGTLLGGTLRYRTPLQLGIRLHGTTESFLVIMETPAAASPPHGTVSAILSTYGLDDATFEDVRQRWERWWAASMPRGATA